jgi:hypothetical protein
MVLMLMITSVQQGDLRPLHEVAANGITSADVAKVLIAASSSASTVSASRYELPSCDAADVQPDDFALPCCGSMGCRSLRASFRQCSDKASSKRLSVVPLVVLELVAT